MGKAPCIPNSVFIEVWNRSASAFEVAAELCHPRNTIINKANHLRRQGHTLKKMKQGQDSNRRDIRVAGAAQGKGKIAQRLGKILTLEFFQEHQNTSFVWMANLVGLNLKTVRKHAAKLGFADRIAGNKTIRHFACGPALRCFIDGLILSDANLQRVHAGLRISLYARARNLFYDLVWVDVPPSLQHRFRRTIRHQLVVQ